MSHSATPVYYPMDLRSINYEDTEALWEGDVKMRVSSGSKKPKDERHIKICGLWLYVYRPKNKEKPASESYHHLDLTTIASTSDDLVSLTYKKANNPQKSFRILLSSASIIDAVRALRTALKTIHCGAAEMNYVALCLSPQWLEKTEPQSETEITVAGGIAEAYRAQCSYHDALWTRIFSQHADMLSGKGKVFDMTDCPGVAASSEKGNVTNIPLAITALADDRHFNSLIIRDVDCADAVGAVGNLLGANRTVTKIIIENVCSTSPHALDSWFRAWKLSAVQVLSFANTRLPSGSFIDFAHALEHSDVPLQVLDLTNCHLNRKAVGAVIDAVYNNITLTSALRQFSLAGNSFGSDTWNKLILWLDTYGNELPLSSLSIANTGAPLVTLLPVLKSITHITRMDISGNAFAPGKTGEKLDILPQSLRSLAFFNASNVGLRPDSVETFLSSFWSNRTDGGSPIAVNLSHNSLGADGGVAIARACSALKYVTELDLSYNKIPSAQLIEILRGIKSSTFGIERLYFADNVGYGSDKEQPNLMKELMTFSEQQPSLQLIDISTHGKPQKGVLNELFVMLGNNRTLRYLDISGYKICDMGAAYLTKALSTNSSLTQLVYDRNDITVTGWQCLAHVLERNTTMQHLDLPYEDYRAQVANHSKNTLAFAKLVQSQSDISRFSLRNYNKNLTEALVPAVCMVDIEAPSSSFVKVAPIQKAARTTTHIVPTVSPDSIKDEDSEQLASPTSAPPIPPAPAAPAPPAPPAPGAAAAAAAVNEDDEAIVEDDYDDGTVHVNEDDEEEEDAPPPPPRS